MIFKICYRLFCFLFIATVVIGIGTTQVEAQTVTYPQGKIQQPPQRAFRVYFWIENSQPRAEVITSQYEFDDQGNIIAATNTATFDISDSCQVQGDLAGVEFQIDHVNFSGTGFIVCKVPPSNVLFSEDPSPWTGVTFDIPAFGAAQFAFDSTVNSGELRPLWSLANINFAAGDRTHFMTNKESLVQNLTSNPFKPQGAHIAFSGVTEPFLPVADFAAQDAFLNQSDFINAAQLAQSRNVALAWVQGVQPEYSSEYPLLNYNYEAIPFYVGGVPAGGIIGASPNCGCTIWKVMADPGKPKQST